MSIPETVLIFVGCPALILAAGFAAIYGPSEMRKPNRYRPGRPWPHHAAWYLPHQIIDEPTAPTPVLHDGRAVLPHLEPAALQAAAIVTPPARKAEAFGGASGEW